MKLPSLTPIVFFLVILGLIFLSYRIYTRVAIEGKKALKEATADIDAYDAAREKKNQYHTPQNFGGGTKRTKKDVKEAGIKAEKAREILEKKASEARARKQGKK